MELDQIFKLAKDSEIEAVDLKLCNLFGGCHHITLTVDRLNEELFKTGIRGKGGQKILNGEDYRAFQRDSLLYRFKD